MARQPRIQYPNAWYYVTHRSLGDKEIFKTKHDRRILLALIGEAASLFKTTFHAFSLLDHQYHLLIHTPHGNLSQCMKYINGVYTQKINSIRQSIGPLFRGRYQSKVVEEGRYLLEVLRYIHLSPVGESLILDPTWTSHLAYIKHNDFPWLNTKRILQLLDPHEKKAQVFLSQFVKAGVSLEIQKAVQNSHAAIGSFQFKAWIDDQYD